ncbi:MAG: hypothetical protein KGQ48_07640 [Bradyrhizobium sp.]|nr:hypothetical protein [Bradyrhizobium sp.]
MREKVTDSWLRNGTTKMSHADWPQGKIRANPGTGRADGFAENSGPLSCLVGGAIKMVRNGLGGAADFSYLQW